jgi:hypothetical protein
VADIALMRSEVGPSLGVKASGGVKDRATLERMVAAGANAGRGAPARGEDPEGNASPRSGLTLRRARRAFSTTSGSRSQATWLLASARRRPARAAGDRRTIPFDSPGFPSRTREYVTWTGTWKGFDITVMATGMGPDNTEIAMVEPLHRAKAPVVIRVGTCGGLTRDVRPGISW